MIREGETYTQGHTALRVPGLWDILAEVHGAGTWVAFDNYLLNKCCLTVILHILRMLLILTLTDEHFPNRALPPLPWWTELTAPSQGEGSVGKRDGGKAGARDGRGRPSGAVTPLLFLPSGALAAF